MTVEITRAQSPALFIWNVYRRDLVGAPGVLAGAVGQDGGDPIDGDERTRIAGGGLHSAYRAEGDDDIRRTDEGRCDPERVSIVFDVARFRRLSMRAHARGVGEVPHDVVDVTNVGIRKIKKKLAGHATDLGDRVVKAHGDGLAHAVFAGDWKAVAVDRAVALDDREGQRGGQGRAGCLRCSPLYGRAAATEDPARG